jgi:hypothetical protein
MCASFCLVVFVLCVAPRQQKNLFFSSLQNERWALRAYWSLLFSAFCSKLESLVHKDFLFVAANLRFEKRGAKRVDKQTSDKVLSPFDLIVTVLGLETFGKWVTTLELKYAQVLVN